MWNLVFLRFILCKSKPSKIADVNKIITAHYVLHTLKKEGIRNILFVDVLFIFAWHILLHKKNIFTFDLSRKAIFDPHYLIYLPLTHQKSSLWWHDKCCVKTFQTNRNVWFISWAKSLIPNKEFHYILRP